MEKFSNPPAPLLREFFDDDDDDDDDEEEEEEPSGTDGVVVPLIRTLDTSM